MKIIREFDTLGELLAKADSSSDCPLPMRASRTPQSEVSGFYHTASYEVATNMARFGWPEGLKKIEEYYKRIKTDVTAIGKKFQVHDQVFGQDIEMGRYLNGEPECMLNFEEEETPGQKNITLGINCTAAYHITTDQFFRRGAATMVLLDFLEDNGYSCGITLQEHITSWKGGQYHVEVNLKNPGEPLDLDKLTFMNCNADVLRRIMFSLEETEPMNIRNFFGFGKDVGGGYGRVVRVPLEHHKDIQVPELGSREWSEFSNAEEWIIKQLKEQGVNIIE